MQPENTGGFEQEAAPCVRPAPLLPPAKEDWSRRGREPHYRDSFLSRTLRILSAERAKEKQPTLGICRKGSRYSQRRVQTYTKFALPGGNFVNRGTLLRRLYAFRAAPIARCGKGRVNT